MSTKKKAHVQPGENEQELIARLKREFLEYYTKLPIQRAAADFIGRDEDTIIRWRKEDPEFAEAIQKAKSSYALTHGSAKTDTILKRLYDEFQPDKQSLAEISIDGQGQVLKVL